MKNFTKNTNSNKPSATQFGKFFILTLLMLGLFSVRGFAATITAVASGNWNATNTAIWSPAQVPTSGDDVVIGAGYTITVTSDVGTIKSLTVGNTITSTLNIAGFSITVTGLTTINNNGVVNVTSNAGTKSFGGITINGTGIWNCSNVNITVSAGGITNNGTFTSGANTYTFTGGTPTIAGTVTIAGTATVNSGITLTNTGIANIATLNGS